MNLFQEAIDTFNVWISPVRLQRAKDKYEQMSHSQVGQKNILEDAKNGSVQAADFLFDKYKSIIAKAFWKYFLGPNQKMHKRRISSGADKDFASAAYEMLLGSGEDLGTSPYKTFNPNKFSPEADLIRQFGYYVFRYLQNEAFKMLRAEKMQGITGNVGADSDFGVSSYEGMTTDVEGKPTGIEGEESALQSPDTFTMSTDMKETLKAFLQKLKKENMKYYNVFLNRLQGKSVNETADALGISNVTVRNITAAIEPMWKRFIGE